MTREELVETVRRNRHDTLIAYRMREALGLSKPEHRSRTKGKKERKYRGARNLMKQRYGVRL